MNPIEQNALYILKIMVEDNLKRVGGHRLNEKTGFKPQEINDAVEYLEDLDAVDVLRGMGTAPYKFFNIAVKSRGRYLYHEIFSESKGSIINGNNRSHKDENKEISSDEIVESISNIELLPKFEYPIGSPYGFTEDNWDEIVKRKRDKNQLYVIFGLQYDSKYYDTEKLVEKIENYFESAIENFKSNHPIGNNINLNFKKLTAGYGSHVFNTIAESIIGSDIAIFELSDRNPNVMIELGVALTWGRRAMLLRELKSQEAPSDISGHYWIEYENSGEKIRDDDFIDRLNIMVEREILKKRK